MVVQCIPRRVLLAFVSVQKGQTIVRKGPYRYFRPPSYTGAILIMIGMGLDLRSWGAVIVLPLASAAVYGYRIRVEEKPLVERFGE